MTIFLAANAYFLNTCQNGNVHTYATTQELKKKEFTLNSKNMKQEIGLQLTFHLDIEIEKVHFQQNMTIFAATNSFMLNCCQDGNKDKYATTSELEIKEFMINSHNIKEAIGIQETFYQKVKLRKVHFQQNMTVFSATESSVLNPCEDRNVHPNAAK